MWGFCVNIMQMNTFSLLFFWFRSLFVVSYSRSYGTPKGATSGIRFQDPASCGKLSMFLLLILYVLSCYRDVPVCYIGC